MPQAILRLLGRQDYAPANVPQLLQRLGCRPGQQQALQKALRALEQNGQIIRNKGNRYILARQADLVPGVIRMNRQGKGFLEPDDRRPAGNRCPGKRHFHRPARRPRPGAARRFPAARPGGEG